MRDRAAVDAAARRRGLVAGVVLGALVAAALVVIAARGEGPGEALGGELAGSGSPAPTASPDATASPDSTPLAPEVPLEPPPDEPVEPPPREPTEEDAADFAASHRPAGATDVESVTVDLDGDGRREVVVVAIADGVVQLDVAAWGGEEYEVVYSDQGGPADVVTAFEVVDVTGDGRREIAVSQSTPERESLALWGLGPTGVEPLRASGGCWDGSHVYGHRGASAAEGELVATCDPADDPDLAPGARASYIWDGMRWAHERTEGA